MNQSAPKIFHTLPCNSADFAPNLSQSSAIDLQVRLTEFVQSALKQSRSGTLSPGASLEILDKAWKVQKLVWQLRSHLPSNLN